MNWMEIPGAPDYEVSEDGDVRSIDRFDTSGARRKGRPLKPYINHGGYLDCRLMINGKAKGFRIHQLVMLAFVGPCPEGHIVHHVDGNTKHNHIDNLEYVTPATNSRSSSKVTRLTQEDVDAIRQSNLSAQQLAGKYNIVKGHVYDILKFKVWKGD